MLIGGLQKTSLIDYPGKVSAIIFTAGCNFRCGFCYNKELVTDIDKNKLIPESEVLSYLKKRSKILDAVVITGGEPTLHKDLDSFIEKIRKFGYLIKLDSNGTDPAMLKKLVDKNLIDYIAMDIKSPIDKYSKTVSVKLEFDKILESIKIIKESGLPYEFRSTIMPRLHTKADIEKMAKLIKGSPKYFLQKFHPTETHNDSSFKNEKSFTDREMKEFAKVCEQYVGKCKVR